VAQVVAFFLSKFLLYIFIFYSFSFSKFLNKIEKQPTNQPNKNKIEIVGQLSRKDSEQ
jgi:hypothetical protein